MTREERVRKANHLLTTKPKKVEWLAKQLINGGHKADGYLLLARSLEAQGQKKEALVALDEFEKLCPKDFAAENPVAYHDAAIMRARLSQGINSEDAIADAEERKAQLVNEIDRKHYAALVAAAEKQGDPGRAAEAFDEYAKHSGSLKPSEAFHGVVLYVTTYQYDKAKDLWPKLSVDQKNQLRERFKDLPF
jgi:tetratricopeptide (TPR) repeat protein